MIRIWAFFTLTLLLLFGAAASIAGPADMLDAEARARFEAVGRVNGVGFSARRGCTGTLIAPDLVVTAAHCTGGTLRIGPARHFVAGWYKSRFRAHRVSEDIEVHPLYPLKAGTDRFAHDLALIRLGDPIPPGLVTPIPLLARDAPAPQEALLLGYQNRRPNALSGQSGCAAAGRVRDSLLVFDCEVFGGMSGGAVIVETSDGPALAAVIVARQGTDGDALVVPINTWLRDAWQKALLRDAARRAR